MFVLTRAAAAGGRPKKKFERVLCCVDGAKVALRTNYLFFFKGFLSPLCYSKFGLPGLEKVWIYF